MAMTKREFLNVIADMDIDSIPSEEVLREVAEHARIELAKMANEAEKRKNYKSKADKEREAQNEELMTFVYESVLGDEAMTATDVMNKMNEGRPEEEFYKVQKVSYLCRTLVERGLASQTEISIPKKGKQKAYTRIA